MQINILGTPYEIIISNKKEHPALNSCDGYCDNSTKKCIVYDCKDTDSRYAVENLSESINRVMRHELVHAFLFESGLHNDSWAANEAAVDWIANQFPKILKAFQEAGCI